MTSMTPTSAFANVNGISMYYETYGKGQPLVLIPGGGSTIQTSFAQIIPHLAKHFKVIAVEMQNHGRSGFRMDKQTFEQDADDVAALVRSLGLDRASFLGFSNGGTTALQLAIRHPAIVDRLVLAAAASKRNGLIEGFFDGMKQATLDHMPGPLKEAFLKVNPDPDKLQVMFEKDRDRMIAFEDIPDSLVESISFPALIISGDADVTTTEHALELHRAIPYSRLLIVPGIHGSYVGEIIAQPIDTGLVEFVASAITRFLSSIENRQS